MLTSRNAAAAPAYPESRASESAASRPQTENRRAPRSSSRTTGPRSRTERTAATKAIRAGSGKSPTPAADPPAEQRCQPADDHGRGHGEQDDLPAPRAKAREARAGQRRFGPAAGSDENDEGKEQRRCLTADEQQPPRRDAVRRDRRRELCHRVGDVEV